MAISAGEIEILLKAKDEATAAIGRVGEAVRKLGPDAERASSSTNLLDASFAKLTASFSVSSLINKAVGGIVSMGAASIESASNIVDLASKTGLTMGEIQRMGYVATQTGSTLEAFTSASYKLGLSLASGSPGVTQAVADLGLEFNKLRQLSPTDQFNQVVAALRNVEGETERNRIAQELFSRSFQGIAAAVGQGYDDIKAKAVVSTNEQLKAVSETKNAWDGFVKNFSSSITSQLGSAMLALQENQKQQIERFKQSSEAAGGYKVSLDDLSEAQRAQLKAAVAAISAESGLTAQVDTASLTRTKYTEVLSRYREQLAKIEPETRAEIEAALELGTATERIAKDFTLSTQQVELLKQQFAEHKKKTEELTDAVNELDTAGRGWRGTLEGVNAELVPSIKRYLDAGVAQNTLATAYQLTAVQVAAVAKALDVEKKAAMETQKLWAEYAEVRVQAGGTATQQTIAQVQRWAQEVSIRMKQAGADTHLFYEALAAVSREKIESSVVDWDRLATVSKKHLEDIAMRARATYEAMVADAANYGSAAIQTQRDVARAAEDAARNYRDANFQALEEVTAKAEAESQKQIEIAQRTAKQLAMPSVYSVSNDIQPATRTQLDQLRGGAEGSIGDDRIWQRLKDLEYREGNYNVRSADDYYAMIRDQVELSQLRMWANGRTRPPGFAGGVKNFKGGRAIVGEAGPEMVDLPTGSNVVPNGDFGGGVSVVFHKGAIVFDSPIVLDQATANALANRFGDAVVAKIRGRGGKMPILN